MSKRARAMAEIIRMSEAGEDITLQGLANNLGYNAGHKIWAEVDELRKAGVIEKRSLNPSHCQIIYVGGKR